MAKEITSKRVLNLAVPIILGNITVPILGAVDTGVVGQLGEAAPIGAVGLGAIILTTVFWLFGFLRMGTTGLTGQAHGQGDKAEVDALLSRALLVGGFAGCVLIALQAPILWAAFQVAPASDRVEALARDYTQIRIWSAPAAIAVYGITGWLIAQERAAAVLIIQLWMNGVNVILDLWFVLGLGWGVSGVAFATFLAEWSGAALGLWYCRGVFARPAWRAVDRVFDPTALLRFFAVGGDILVRSVALMAAFTSFTFWGARFGDVTLAANQILMQFLHIAGYAMDGFAFAAEALVAQAFGKGQVTQLRRAAVVSSLWALAFATVFSAVFVLGGPMIIDIMTTAQEVRQDARSYLLWVALAPVLMTGAVMLDGIFIGATRGRDMRNMMVVSFAVYLGLVALLMPAYGNHGLWAAMVVFLLVRGITLFLRYPALERAVRQG